MSVLIPAGLFAACLMLAQKYYRQGQRTRSALMFVLSWAYRKSKDMVALGWGKANENRYFIGSSKVPPLSANMEYWPYAVQA